MPVFLKESAGIREPVPVVLSATQVKEPTMSVEILAIIDDSAEVIDVVSELRDFLNYTRKQENAGCWMFGVEEYAGRWIVDIHCGHTYFNMKRPEFESRAEVITFIQGFACGLVHQ